MADPSFLGTGWSFPPTFSAHGKDILMVSGEDDIHQSLEIILSTRLGERVMLESFGSDLSYLIFEEIDRSFKNTLTSLVTNAILNHEARIKLNKVDFSSQAELEGLIFINLDYSVPSTNSRFNMVYPFYLNESVQK